MYYNGCPVLHILHHLLFCLRTKKKVQVKDGVWGGGGVCKGWTGCHGNANPAAPAAPAADNLGNYHGTGAIPLRTVLLNGE